MWNKLIFKYFPIEYDLKFMFNNQGFLFLGTLA